jgi:hypothetical protein
LASLPMERRLAAIEQLEGAKDRLQAAHALLEDVAEFSRRVSACRAMAAVVLVEDGDKDGRIYSQLEVSRLLDKSSSLGQHLVTLGREIRDHGGPKPVARPSRAERAERRRLEMEAAARRLLQQSGQLPVDGEAS